MTKRFVAIENAVEKCHSDPPVGGERSFFPGSEGDDNEHTPGPSRRGELSGEAQREALRFLSVSRRNGMTGGMLVVRQ